MNLQTLLAEGRLRAHRTSAKEVADLLRVAHRDLADAAVSQTSTDRRFATAYSAALALATVVLHAAGYRTVGIGHHWATFRVLSEIMGTDLRARADYLENCRTRRNTAEYDQAGVISEGEAQEVLAEAGAFRGEVLAWLRDHYPSLVPADSS